MRYIIISLLFLLSTIIPLPLNTAFADDGGQGQGQGQGNGDGGNGDGGNGDGGGDQGGWGGGADGWGGDAGGWGSDAGGWGGGGGQGSVASRDADRCPLTLEIHMVGKTTTVPMTSDGVLCESCVAVDPNNQIKLELGEGTRVVLGNEKPPHTIEVTLAGSPPLPGNAVAVQAVYELNAYSHEYRITPSPVSISPPARMTLAYAPDELPENTSSLCIAYYDEDAGKWLELETAGYVAEAAEVPNTIAGPVSHLTLFTVLANLAETMPAKFETSNLTISPTQAQLNQEITVTVSVTNSGGTVGDYNLELVVDGIAKATKQNNLAPEMSQTVTFTVTGDTVGRHCVEVAGLTGEFEIKRHPMSGVNSWLWVASWAQFY